MISHFFFTFIPNNAYHRMNFKSIISAIILAAVIIILFNNREEAPFWLFGTIYTSKLIVLGVFFLLGLIAGGFLFRRRKKAPKEYTASNQYDPTTSLENPDSNLSEEDRNYLRRD